MKETEINLESIKSLELMKHQPTFNEVMDRNYEYVLYIYI